MKKIIGYSLLAICVLFSQVSCAQLGNKKIRGNGNITTVTRALTSFNSVTSMGSYEVYLLPGNTPSVKIEGEQNLLPYMETTVNGNELLIKEKKGYNLHFTQPMKIYVTVTSLNKISLLGSGDVESKGEIPGNNMQIKLAGSGNMSLQIKSSGDITNTLTGSGNMKINLIANNCVSKITGSGNMQLNGNANDITLAVTGSGNLDATKLSGKNWNVSKTGSGNVMH